MQTPDFFTIESFYKDLDSIVKKNNFSIQDLLQQKEVAKTPQKTEQISTPSSTCNLDPTWESEQIGNLDSPRNTNSTCYTDASCHPELVSGSVNHFVNAVNEKKLFKEHFFIFAQIDSTNSELLRQLKTNCVKDKTLRGQDGTLTPLGKKLNLKLVASLAQTNGRGRVGRSFYSPKNNGIYFSFIYAPLGSVKNPALYTVTSCVCVCRAIEKLYNVSLQIKWVNDIYLQGKKICGILTEGFINPYKNQVEAIVVGIGINIKLDKNAPEEVSKKAGGILLEKESSNVTRSKLLAQCVFELYSTLKNYYTDISEQKIPKDIIEEYKKRSLLTNKTVTILPIAGNSEQNNCLQYKAKVQGITDDANLIVTLPDGTKKILSSGEVSLHGM